MAEDELEFAHLIDPVGHPRGIVDGGIEVALPPHEHPPIIDGGIDPVATTVTAEAAIEAKWEALARSPGASLFDGPDGLIPITHGFKETHGFKRNYSNGTIYWKSYGTAFWVEQSTDVRYDQLGGPRSFLGWPLSDFVVDPDDSGSGVTRFEGGAIYYWPDVGAIEMREVALRFVGFHCFGETEELSASDEVYFTFGVVPTQVELQGTYQTRVISDVDAGESHSDLYPMELYRGLPLGAAVSITLIEHDEGDPNKYRDLVKKGVDKAADEVEPLLAEVPVVGALLAVVGTFVLEVAKPALTDAINDLIGTGEDILGTVPLAVTPKDMMRLTRVGQQSFSGVMAHLESPLISGQGASYKAYFDIVVP
ncbi:MAG TPA: hypothetical protein VFA56_10200 [Gaiellaceae bacterium]|nr:hypothetical protein [Gaiellaceae bacterium]